ncbi:hypothetical protein BJV78DRAFT_1282137 [Lactifluus subvellereus]|nr:hypothetical protein BJV78DRAFT_1282137 [Lactifluus subvellereus]
MVQLTAAFNLLPVIAVRTLAFSWRKHDFSGPFPDAEHPIPQDLSIPAAISMTLCELRTAEFHSIPLECEVFLEEGGLRDRALHSVCVEALSRSTQSWASYSGYLREIPQLCLAYQQNLALEIYRNATIEKVAYIRHLVKRAEKEDESHARWQSLLVDLQRSIDSLQVSPGLSDRIYTDIADTVLNEFQQVMRTQKRAFDEHLQESTERSLALSDHARTLVTLSTEFERDFSARMNTAYELLDSRLSEVFAASDKMWQQVTLIEKGLLSAMNMIAQLSTSANHLSDALTSGVHEIKSMHIAQANAVRATARLAGTLQQMDETVIDALVEINNTAIRVNQTIGNLKGLNSFHPNLVSLAGATVIYREDDPSRISVLLYRRRGD